MNTHTHEHVLTSVILAETLTSEFAFNGLPAFDKYCQTIGLSEFREWLVGTLTPVTDAAWAQAAAEGYDAPFDLEFVPAFLAVLDEQATLHHETIAFIVGNPTRVAEAITRTKQ